MATVRTVNKALKAAGLDVEIIRGNGYFWFMDETTAIRSWYSYSLTPFTDQQVVDHVKEELERIAKEA